MRTRNQLLCISSSVNSQINMLYKNGCFLGILVLLIATCSCIDASTMGSKLTMTPGMTMQPTTVFSIKKSLQRSNATERLREAVPKLHYSNVSKAFSEKLKKYDKKFRPYYGEQPVEIIIDFHVLSFGDINEVEMEYTLDVYFLQVWYDPRFMVNDSRFENATVELIGPQLQDLWLPDTIFVNSKRSKFHAITIDNRFMTIYLADGLIAYHSRITMTAACKMDLRRYPFDTQGCKLAIESYGHDEKDIKYSWRREPTCAKDCDQIYIYDKEMSNFEILEARKTKEATVYHAEKFSKATASFAFRRRRQYFVFRIYIPSILIVMVSWSTFWISQDAVPARAGICITTILTLITMLGVVNTNMPKVSYIKAIDLYLLMSFIFVFASLVEYIIVLNFRNCYGKEKKKAKNEQAETENDHVVHKSSVTVTVKAEEDMMENQPLNHYGLQNGCLRRQTSISPPERGRHNNTSLEDKISKRIRRIKDNWQKASKRPATHLVDKIARFIFPFSYGVFNFVYWWQNLK